MCAFELNPVAGRFRPAPARYFDFRPKYQELATAPTMMTAHKIQGMVDSCMDGGKTKVETFQNRDHADLVFHPDSSNHCGV